MLKVRLGKFPSELDWDSTCSEISNGSISSLISVSCPVTERLLLTYIICIDWINCLIAQHEQLRVVSTCEENAPLATSRPTTPAPSRIRTPCIDLQPINIAITKATH